MIGRHSAPSRLPSVVQSPLISTFVTPSLANSAAPTGSSAASSALKYERGLSPSDRSSTHLSALGFGVRQNSITRTPIAHPDPPRVDSRGADGAGLSTQRSPLNPAERIRDLIDRVTSYSLPEILFELAVIWLIVWAVVRFVQGTRAAGALRGIAVIFAFVFVIVVVRVVAGGDAFERLGYLFDRFVAIVAIALVVIFQPELRRAAIRVGEARFFRGTPSEIARVVDAIADACAYLAKARFGAIVVVERDVGLEHLTEGGTILRADLSSRLLQSIFFPGSALHDLAVVIRGNVIHSAGVQLPLAEPGDMPDPGFGARHRAAVGLSAECDAHVVVVSEETGHIRLAERGRLSRPLTSDDLRAELTRRLRKEPPKAGRTAAEAEESKALKPDSENGT